MPQNIEGTNPTNRASTIRAIRRRHEPAAQPTFSTEGQAAPRVHQGFRASPMRTWLGFTTGFASLAVVSDFFMFNPQ